MVQVTESVNKKVIKANHAEVVWSLWKEYLIAELPESEQKRQLMERLVGRPWIRQIEDMKNNIETKGEMLQNILWWDRHGECVLTTLRKLELKVDDDEQHKHNQTAYLL